MVLENVTGIHYLLQSPYGVVLNLNYRCVINRCCDYSEL